VKHRSKRDWQLQVCIINTNSFKLERNEKMHLNQLVLSPVLRPRSARRLKNYITVTFQQPCHQKYPILLSLVRFKMTLPEVPRGHPPISQAKADPSSVLHKPNDPVPQKRERDQTKDDYRFMLLDQDEDYGIMGVGATGTLLSSSVQAANSYVIVGHSPFDVFSEIFDRSCRYLPDCDAEELALKSKLSSNNRNLKSMLLLVKKRPGHGHAAPYGLPGYPPAVYGTGKWTKRVASKEVKEEIRRSNASRSAATSCLSDRHPRRPLSPPQDSITY